jgi:hypothetical protein
MVVAYARSITATYMLRMNLAYAVCIPLYCMSFVAEARLFFAWNVISGVRCLGLPGSSASPCHKMHCQDVVLASELGITARVDLTCIAACVLHGNLSTWVVPYVRTLCICL